MALLVHLLSLQDCENPNSRIPRFLSGYTSQARRAIHHARQPLRGSAYLTFHQCALAVDRPSYTERSHPIDARIRVETMV
jgi:hypothetical protein